MLEVIDDGKVEEAARSAASALAHPDSTSKVGWQQQLEGGLAGQLSQSVRLHY